MSRETENLQWIQGKNNAMRDYTENLKKNQSAIAARNFYLAPGFATEAGVMIERDAKLKLAELNMKITEHSVQRELQEVEHNYKVSVQEYKIQWQIDKQTLLNEMQVYITELKRLQEIDEELIKRETISIEAQRSIIMDAQTAIQLTMEGYRQEEINIRSEALGYDRLLVQAEKETALERLNLIPILEQLVTEEEKVINRMAEELVPAKVNLLAVLEELLARKEDLIPLQIAIQKRAYGLIGDEVDQAEDEKDIVRKQIEVTDKAGHVVDRQIRNSEIEREIAEKQQVLIDHQESGVIKETANINKEVEIAEKEQDVLAKETEVTNRERGLADDMKDYAVQEKVLADTQTGTIGQESANADKEVVFREAYLEMVDTMLNIDEIRKAIEERNTDLLHNELTYLEIRKLIAEKKKALRDIEIDWLLDRLYSDIALSEYRANTQHNASISKSIMDVGNRDSAGVDLNPDHGGLFLETEDNMDNIKTEIRTAGEDLNRTMRTEKLEHNRDEHAKDVHIQTEEEFSGAWIGPGYSGGWNASGTIEKGPAKNAAADYVATQIVSGSKVQTRLKHILGTN